MQVVRPGSGHACIAQQNSGMSKSNFMPQREDSGSHVLIPLRICFSWGLLYTEKSVSFKKPKVYINGRFTVIYCHEIEWEVHMYVLVV